MPKGRYGRLVQRDAEGNILGSKLSTPTERPKCGNCIYPIVYAPPVGRDNDPKQWRHANTFKIRCHNKDTVATPFKKE